MTEPSELLRDSLREIADRVGPIDMYERSLARSRRIGRNRVLLGTAAATVGVVLAGGVLAQVSQRAAPVLPPPGASIGPPASATPTTSTAAESVAGLAGTLYYVDGDGEADRLLRLTRSGPVTVLRSGGYLAAVAPDDSSIAYVANENLIVTDRNGAKARTILRRTAGDGYEPVWSPDSRTLLVRSGPEDRQATGTVDAATGRFTALPVDFDGIHPLWSADGAHIGYSTGTCQLGITDAQGRNARIVPVLGNDDRAVNPRQARSCGPYSIAPDGSRMAVDLHVGDEPDGDIARYLIADTVIDTATGATVKLPVTGAVLAVLFQPDGGMLIRTEAGGRKQLTLVSAAGTVVAQVAEPASVREFSLLAHVGG